MRDGSYLRLKNLELGYTLPTRWMNRIYLNKVRIYFMGTNLLTFSSFKLWDPEMGSGTGEKYPLSKTYTLGLTLTYKTKYHEEKNIYIISSVRNDVWIVLHFL